MSTVQRTQEVMGTVVTFDIAQVDDPPAPELLTGLARSQARLRRYDAIFSLWKPNSPMSQLRRKELRLEEVPREVTTVLELCDRAYEMTRGFFDARSMPGAIDPTGLVKGFATESALAVLIEAGFPHSMVNAGGDIALSGHPDDGQAWRIGIENPLVRGHLLGVVEVESAIATSGTYERGAHLYNPFTKQFGSNFVSASVIGPSLAIADALATALAVAGDPGFEFIEVIDGYEAVGVDGDGLVRHTSGFKFADTPDRTDLRSLLQ